MNVFPGRVLTVPVTFEVGGDPVSPNVASYRVVDSNLAVIVPDTAITVPSGASSVYVVIPVEAHEELLPGQKFRQLRMEVSFTADGGVFTKEYVYYVVPDLFLSFSDTDAKNALGLSDSEVRPGFVNYYRSYVELATGEIGDDFYNAIMGTDMPLALAARNLIFYASLKTVLPTAHSSMFKSIESETSKVTRFDNDFTRIGELIDAKYAFYYAQIKLISTQNIGPTFIVLDSPTDAITGA